MPLNAMPDAHPPLRRFVRRFVDSLAAWPVTSADDARAMIALVCRSNSELDAAMMAFRRRVAEGDQLERNEPR